MEWGSSLQGNYPGAPPVETGLQLVVAIRRMVKFEDRPPDRIEQEIADRVAEEPARHRGESAIGGQPPRLARPRQDHRDQQDVGRYRKERAFDERDDQQRRQRIRAGGDIEYTD